MSTTGGNTNSSSVGRWYLAAACVGVDPEVFFPLDLTPNSTGVVAAKRMCA